MAQNYSGRVSPPPGIAPRRAGWLVATLTLAGGIAGFVAGHAGSAGAPSAPIELHDGVPVGVEHSPLGAVAAADNYLAAEQQTVERDPARFAGLVAADYASDIRSDSLASAEADRRNDPIGMALWARGGESFTVIGAHRLDAYTGDRATVTTWAGQIYWGPGQPPAQTWALGQTTLAWVGGRWRVREMSTLPTPGPSPAATPQAGPGNDSASRFDALLRGFTLVIYEATGP